MSPCPRISVIIPAWHSDRVIRRCLEALRLQTLSDFEVIVVNSSTEDGTRQLLATSFPEVVYLESGRRLLPHAARNRGVLAARGQLLVFTDPDCRAAPNWLERLVEGQSDGHQVVCGSIESERRGWFQDAVHLCKYSFRLSGLPAGTCWIAGTANACYSRRAWETVGPFDGECFAGDAILSWRAATCGWQPWFEPKAVVTHEFDHTPIELWRERLERGADFGTARADWERWSRLQLTAYMLALPVLPLMQLARGGRDAFRSGQGLAFLSTAILQLFGHLAWSLGEARSYSMRLADASNRTSRSTRPVTEKSPLTR